MYTAELIYNQEKLFVKDFPSENKGAIGVAVRFFNECNCNFSLRRRLMTGDAIMNLYFKKELLYQIKVENLKPKK